MTPSRNQHHSNLVFHPRPGKWLLHDPSNPEHHRGFICHRHRGQPIHMLQVLAPPYLAAHEGGP